jgi:hypothetical protein
MRDFWIPTFATRWLPDVLAGIETLAGWKFQNGFAISG